jgi:hypothetical protein
MVQPVKAAFAVVLAAVVVDAAEDVVIVAEAVGADVVARRTRNGSLLPSLVVS